MVLEDVVQDVKSSHMFNEIESLIDEMIENVGKIRKNRENNSVAVTEQKQIIESEIRELRTKINNHLDKPFIVLVTKFSNFQNIRRQFTVFRYWYGFMVSGGFR
jgi:uncharacterized protein Yka (UPF0111/DUF47 family)